MWFEYVPEFGFGKQALTQNQNDTCASHHCYFKLTWVGFEMSLIIRSTEVHDVHYNYVT